MGPHRALNINEILRLIFDHALDYDESEGELKGRTNLVSCALCCTSFSAIALDILWLEMDSFIPFLELLPSIQLVDDVYCLYSGSVSTSSLSRFHQYARRLRVFKHTLQEDGAIDSSVYVHLAQLQKGVPLFPSLRALELDGEFDSHTLPFLSPSLRSIDFCVGGLSSIPAIETLLHICADESPSVESFSLRFHPLIFPENILPTILDPVFEFQRLRRIRLSYMNGSIDRECLIALSRLERLIQLDVSLDFSQVALDDGTISPGFSSLKILAVVGQSLGALHFLNIVDAAAPLTRCTVRFCHIFCGSMTTLGRLQQDLDILRTSFSNLSSKFSRSLTSLEVDTWTSERPQAGDRSRPFPDELSCVSVIEPLLNFPRLETLQVRLATSPLSLSDEFVEKMAISWPMMTSLLLQFASTEVQPTFFALRSLARLCPRLTYLSLNFRAEPTPRLPPLRHHGLKTLAVHPDPTFNIRNPRRVARHLDRLFPSLVTAVSRGSLQEEWRRVDYLLKTCQELRQQDGEQHAVVAPAVFPS